MASRTATSKKPAAGKAQFVVDAEEEALEISLDRHGFHRLLQTLEKLAQTGDDQVFEKSGRQARKGKTKQSETMTIGKLVFRMVGSPEERG
ncbi:MAG: hypothetical protein ACRBM6_12965 [Geminicoccales bacterium]